MTSFFVSASDNSIAFLKTSSLMSTSVFIVPPDIYKLRRFIYICQPLDFPACPSVLLGVDPERCFFIPPWRAGLGTVERVKACTNQRVRPRAERTRFTQER
jgi:hypothetical protein